MAVTQHSEELWSLQATWWHSIIHFFFFSPRRLYSHTDSRGPTCQTELSYQLINSIPLLHCAAFLPLLLTHLKIASNALGPYPWFIWKAINQTHKSSTSRQPRNPHENLHLFRLLLLSFLAAWLGSRHVSLVCAERRRLWESNRQKCHLHAV